MNTCPIQEDFADIQISTASLAYKIRRLQRKLLQCNECQGQDCPFLTEFRQSIDAALIEVSTELGLIDPPKTP